MSIPLYSCQFDPLTLPVVRDPEIVPAVGELYRHRESGALRRVKSLGNGSNVVIDRPGGTTLTFLADSFWSTFIHASAREDA